MGLNTHDTFIAIVKVEIVIFFKVSITFVVFIQFKLIMAHFISEFIDFNS